MMVVLSRESTSRRDYMIGFVMLMRKNPPTKNK